MGGADSGMTASGPATSNIQDSRFAGQNLAMRPGVVDFRIYQETGEFSVVRVDQFGITFLTPTNISIVAGKQLLLKGQEVAIDGEVISFFPNDPGGTRVVSRNMREI